MRTVIFLGFLIIGKGMGIARPPEAVLVLYTVVFFGAIVSDIAEFLKMIRK